MAISAISPIAQAWDRMKLVLFQKFDSGKWFALGFCAFLAYLGEGGGMNFNIPSNKSLPPDLFQNAKNFISDNFQLVVTIVAVVLLISLVFWIVMVWLSCRGKFMFLDGIVHNRAEVSKPWAKFKELGNNLFRFRIVLDIICSLLSISVLAAAAWIGWSDIQSGELGENGITALIVLVVTMVPIVLTYILIKDLITDFFAPIMYLRNVPVRQSISIFFQELFPGNFWTLTLFYVMKFLLGIGIAMAIGVIVLLTCCLALIVLIIPYISSVALLPVSVFMQSYPLYFMEQFGEGWKFFDRKEEIEKISEVFS